MHELSAALDEDRTEADCVRGDEIVLYAIVAADRSSGRSTTVEMAVDAGGHVPLLQDLHIRAGAVRRIERRIVEYRDGR